MKAADAAGRAARRGTATPLLFRAFNMGLRGLALVAKFALLFVLARFLTPAEVGLYGLLAATGAGLPTVITTSTYTVDEDFSEAEIVVPELGDAPNVRLTLDDLRQLASRRAA